MEVRSTVICKWTDELHATFAQAVDKCGGALAATPTLVRDLMARLGADLTTQQVKSHLQRHRVRLAANAGAKRAAKRARGAAKPARGAAKPGRRGDSPQPSEGFGAAAAAAAAAPVPAPPSPAALPAPPRLRQPPWPGLPLPQGGEEMVPVEQLHGAMARAGALEKALVAEVLQSEALMRELEACRAEAARLRASLGGAPESTGLGCTEAASLPAAFSLPPPCPPPAGHLHSAAVRSPSASLLGPESPTYFGSGGAPASASPSSRNSGGGSGAAASPRAAAPCPPAPPGGLLDARAAADFDDIDLEAALGACPGAYLPPSASGLGLDALPLVW
eukprot:scaffold28.g7561.t1